MPSPSYPPLIDRDPAKSSWPPARKSSWPPHRSSGVTLRVLESTRSSLHPVVIVGAGPAGIHVAREILHRSPEMKVVLYSAEPWEPYNRVLLSELLAGELDWPAIVNPAPFLESGRLELQINTAIVNIDRADQVVIDASGRRLPYSRLVLATGSSPYVPELARGSLLGVYVYRDINDAQTLMTNAGQSSCTVVLGGGTLGVEVARALKTQNPEARIIVVHRGERLMNRELDPDAARVLEEHIVEAGIELRLLETVTRIEGQTEICGVALSGGELIACDTLVICTGIERNTGLARAAGLSVGKGIKVDDGMRTSDPKILAIGECVEHRGEVYGLVAPGIEQAKVAAINISGGSATYSGSHHFLRLKVVKMPVYSIRRGQKDDPSQRVVTYTDKDGASLRRLVVANGRLVGATSIGAWDESEAIHQALLDGTPIRSWQLRRFCRHGRLWSAKPAQDPATRPDSVMLCTCMGVTYGMVRHALAEGHTTIEGLRERTGASRACGSCGPLLASIAGAPSESPTPQKGVWIARGGVVLTALALAGLVVPPLRDGRPWLERRFIDRLLFDSDWKEVTGYLALGLALVGSTLALRKRIRRFAFGQYETWKLLHVALGAATAATVVVHAGFQLGIRLNAAFMLVFSAVLASGGFVGALSPSRAGSALGRGMRAFHLLLVWLLPPLVAAHVLAVYYF